MRPFLYTIFVLLFLFSLCCAQENKYVYSIAFYNVENLYDTEKDKNIDDGEYTPRGNKKWTKDRYTNKLKNLAYVISLLGKESSKLQPVIVGLAEIENKKVLDDLVKMKSIEKTGYRIIHKDSPDRRGSDVAILYNPAVFKADSYNFYSYKSVDFPWIKTRDILLVNGRLGKEHLHIIVNHWPSRRGDASSEQREYAASICKHICDSLSKSSPEAKIIIMGDMNDNPQDKSCRIILNAQKKNDNLSPGKLFNTMWPLYEKGLGSYRYRDKWQMYDQIIITQGLLAKKSPLKFLRAEVFNRDFLIQQNGRFKGYPLRTFSGNTFLNGYSDHFPVLIYLKYEEL